MNDSEKAQQSMTPHRKPNIRNLFWKEALPVGCFIAVLGMIPGNLTRYTSFSAVTNVYIWTIIWLATCLISLRFLVGIGPFTVAAHASTRNFYMLWDLYKWIGDERSCEKVEVGDLIGAGAFSIVAVGVSYYFTTRFNRRPVRENESNDQLNELEKA